MSKIGIIVHPYSGKDLRRITSQATNIGNNEKAIKVARMISSINQFDVKKVYLMPDNYNLNANIASMVYQDPHIALKVELLEFIPTDQPEDTITAVHMMKHLGISCLIVLGGDGTCRLVSKAEIDVPIIPVSTGTNNVYPQFWEGTTVGIAAAYIAKNGIGYPLNRGKQIEVLVNDALSDIALVDAVITGLPYIGSKVVTEPHDVKEVIVSTCSPSFVGFSAIIGNITSCDDHDAFGYRLKLNPEGASILAQISPGHLQKISYSDFQRIDMDTEYISCPSYDGTIALDGERTVSFRAQDQIKFKITRKAPYKVDVLKTLNHAVQNDFFKIHN
jgi:uncharacterized membrane protein (DUF441 family)